MIICSGVGSKRIAKAEPLPVYATVSGGTEDTEEEDLLQFLVNRERGEEGDKPRDKISEVFVLTDYRDSDCLKAC